MLVQVAKLAHPNQRKVRNALAGYIKTFDKTVIEPEPAAKAAAAPTMTYEDAQLQEKIAKARIAELELQEKRGAGVARAHKCPTFRRRRGITRHAAGDPRPDYRCGHGRG